MLDIVLSHWAVYFYIAYVMILFVLCLAYRQRPSVSPTRERRLIQLALISGRAAVGRIVRYRHAGNSALPVGYQYGQPLRTPSPSRWTDAL